MLPFAFHQDDFTNDSAFLMAQLLFDPADLYRVVAARIVELVPCLKTHAFSQEDFCVSGILCYFF